jgi:alpha-tubulin suppressor-like RCC1 family protein
MKKRIYSLILVMVLCITIAPMAAAAPVEGGKTVFLSSYAIALSAKGDLYCWGFNWAGQVGNGSTNTQPKPVMVLANVASFKAVVDTVAAITKNGDLYCWGGSGYGQVGNGKFANQTTPVKVLSNVASVTADSNDADDGAHVFNSQAVTVAAITTSGDLYCWGYNEFGQVGNGQSGVDINQATPVKVLSSVASVTFDKGTAFAVTTSGDLYAWGRNNNGQVGNGQSGEGLCQTTPAKVLSSVASVKVSVDTTAAIATNGDLYCWGANSMGRVGNGASTLQATPVKVLSNVASATPGSTSTAITTNGDLYCWGYAELGQVGNGKHGLEDRQTTPAKIMSNVASVAQTGTNTAAVTTSGDLYCWGTNDWGHLGIGTISAFEYTPVKVLSNVASVTLSGINAAAITKTGDLYCWGENGTGKVGNGQSGIAYGGEDPVGESAVQTTPLKVLSNVAFFAAFSKTVAAITKTGDLYCWGSNEGGQVGNGKLEAVQATPYKALTGVALPSAAPVIAELTATPNSSAVLINGVSVAFKAYTINGSNYFKLRDLAMALNGTTKQFAVGYDSVTAAITLTMGQPYTTVGGELTGTGGGAAVSAIPTQSAVYLDGQKLNLTAYTISGSNYFKLRDIGQAMNFGVTWDGAKNTIKVDTSTGYSA